MYKFHIVGAGSLGGCFATELVKRAAAINVPLEVTIHDYDLVETRNTYSQEFFPNNVGKHKAEVLAERLSYYENITTKASINKITEENARELLTVDDQTIIVDAVDNVECHQLLWKYAYEANVPVMHMGMSTNGDGLISWNYKNVDNYNLSPVTISPLMQKQLEEYKETKLPPCQLNASRSLIVNTSIAGVNAAFIFLGLDATKELTDENGDVIEIKGTATVWNTTGKSMSVCLPLTEVLEWE